MARQRLAVAGAMVLGLLVLALNGRADEITAVEAVRKLGGQVTFEPLLTVNLNGSRLTDAGLKELKELKSLERLGLNGTQVTDAGLRELREFKSLQDLDLGGTQVTDAGLKELKEIKSLPGGNLEFFSHGYAAAHLL